MFSAGWVTQIPNSDSNEFESVTDPTEGLLNQFIEVLMQPPDVMDRLSAVMLEEDQVLIVFTGFEGRKYNAVVEAHEEEVWKIGRILRPHI